MSQYEDLLHDILDRGVDKSDRTGTGIRSVFGRQLRFDLTQGFPLVTTKKVHMKSVIHELLWMIAGYTNVKPLQAKGVTIWDEWADANGDLGPIYGRQWRSWTRYKRAEGGCYNDPVDQLRELIAEIKRNPDSRRLVVSAWNPGEIPQMALAPCHCLFQFNTRMMTAQERIEAASIVVQECLSHERLDELGVPSRYLDLQLYQRSADVFLGVPFNIASYALLTSMVAQVCGMVAGDFIWTGGDVHLYANHFEQAREQLFREARALPSLILNPDVKDLFAFRYEDVTIEGYDPHPAISAPVAV